jgi:hypothetical protein
VQCLEGDVANLNAIDEDPDVAHTRRHDVRATVLDTDLKSVIRIERNPNGLQVPLRLDATAGTIATPVVHGREIAKRSRCNEFRGRRTAPREGVTGWRVEHTGVAIADDAFTEGRIVADSGSAYSGKPLKVTRSVIRHGDVAAVTAHRDA